ncbi:MAG: ABC transporter permease [Alphaproteobacteria bacterium]|nr:ABC transporter permease [Alphaproteobacteria bacterium]
MASLMRAEQAGRGLIGLASWIVLVYLAVPLFVVIAISFTTTEYLSFPPRGLTLRWYWRVASDPTFIEAFLVSGRLATAATGAALVLGVPAAIVFARKRFPGSAVLSAAFLSPLVLPSIVLGAAVLQYASALGFARSFWALFVGHAVLVTPYVIRTALASLSGLEPALEEAAQDLGATPLETFFLITLPQIKPGIVAGALFAFINSWINVEVSIFNSTARLVTIPVKLFDYIQFNIDPTLAAVSAATIYIAILVVVAIDLTVGVERAAIANTVETRA